MCWCVLSFLDHDDISSICLGGMRLKWLCLIGCSVVLIVWWWFFGLRLCGIFYSRDGCLDFHFCDGGCKALFLRILGCLVSVLNSDVFLPVWVSEAGCRAVWKIPTGALRKWLRLFWGLCGYHWRWSVGFGCYSFAQLILRISSRMFWSRGSRVFFYGFGLG